MDYSRRIIDDRLDALFPGLPAISLEGAKGVGKTATGSQRATTIYSLDDSTQRQTVSADVNVIAHAAPPVFIDEWQLVPSVWNRVRRAVDAEGHRAQYLLAGSASPPTEARLHSGAGRIAKFTMRPLVFSERGVSNETVSLSRLLRGEQEQIGGDSALGLPEYIDEILRSGFPGLRSNSPEVREALLDSYLDRIVDRELPDNGITIRRPLALRAWLAAYGAATATDASYSTILNAATPGDTDKPSRSAVDGYREHLHRIFVLDPVPAWIASFSPLRRLAKTPKHHLVDPALAARLAGVSEPMLLSGRTTARAPLADTWLGALFESLVTQSVRVYAEAAGAKIGHLRSIDTTREIDLIVEARDSSVVAIEIKLARDVQDRDVRHLNWLRDELGERVVERVLITTGPHAYRRPDGVAVIPLSLLGP